MPSLLKSTCAITREVHSPITTEVYGKGVFFSFIVQLIFRPGGGGVLPYKRLLGMCRWMGSHFHDWIDYNGVAFLVELLEWGRTFSGFLG